MCRNMSGESRRLSNCADPKPARADQLLDFASQRRSATSIAPAGPDWIAPTTSRWRNALAMPSLGLAGWIHRHQCFPEASTANTSARSLLPSPLDIPSDGSGMRSPKTTPVTHLQKLSLRYMR